MKGKINFIQTRIYKCFSLLSDNKKGIISLENSYADTFKIDTINLPESSNLNLDNFSYDSIDSESLKDMPRSFSYRKLLNSQYKDKQSAFFSPQPYDQLAKALSNSGREEEATKVLIIKQGDRRKHGKLGFWSKLLNIVFALTIRHGYRPSIALIWSAGFIVLGTIFFEYGKQNNLMFPTKANPHVSIQQQKKSGVLRTPSNFVPFVDIQQSQESDLPKLDYAEFVPLVYSIDSFIPIVDLNQKAYWIPKYNSKGLRLYLWIHIAFGWVFTSLWVAGFTGLVRRLE